MTEILRMLQFAAQLHRSRRLAEAKRAYLRVLDADPEDALALLGLGQIATTSGQQVDAERYLRAATRAQPDYASAWFNLGNLLRTQGRWSEAEQCYRQLIDLEPATAAGYLHLAHVLERQQKNDEASIGYQRAAEVRHAGVKIQKRSSFDNIFHCCTQKTASQWFRMVFNDAAFYRYTGLLPYPYAQLGLRYAAIDRPLPPSTIGTHLYIGYGAYSRIPKPAAYKTFFVLRDPRDAVVSWYFSAKYSHVPVEPMASMRTVLADLSDKKGLLYIIDRLQEFGYFEANLSWVEAAVEGGFEIFRYEDLVDDSDAFVRSLLDYLEIDMPEDELADLCRRTRFENFSGGRKPGQEDLRSHYRKGVSGDWRNHFDDDLFDYFIEKTGNLLDSLGYAKAQEIRSR